MASSGSRAFFGPNAPLPGGQPVDRTLLAPGAVFVANQTLVYTRTTQPDSSFASRPPQQEPAPLSGAGSLAV
jgi:hypothetical protein